MGWWKVEGTESVIGDAPLDALHAAVGSVVEHYLAAWNRRPTKTEWELLLISVLGSDDEDDRASGEGIPKKVTVEI